MNSADIVDQKGIRRIGRRQVMKTMKTRKGQEEMVIPVVWAMIPHSLSHPRRVPPMICQGTLTLAIALLNSSMSFMKVVRLFLVG